MPRSTRSVVESMARSIEEKKTIYLFSILNIILLVLSISLIFLMLGLQDYWDFFDPFLKVYKDLHAMGVIFTASVICVCTLFGFAICCLKNSSYCIWYGLSLCILLVLDMKIIMTGIIYKDSAARVVNRTLYNAFDAYNISYKSPQIRHSVDTVQLTLRCCGSRNYADWFDSKFSKVPYTCCPFSMSHGTDAYCLYGDPYFFTIGCLNDLVGIPNLGLTLIFCIVAMLLSIKVLGLLVVLKMEKMFKDY